MIRLYRNPQRRRRILWEPPQSSGRIREPVTDSQPGTVFAQTNPEAVETDRDAAPTPSRSAGASTEWHDDRWTRPIWVRWRGIPFSDAASDYTPGRITDDQSMSSATTRTAKEEVRDAVLLPRLSLRIAKMETRPIFATRKRRRSGRQSTERHQAHFPSKIEEAEEAVAAPSGSSERSPASPPVAGGGMLEMQKHQKPQGRPGGWGL